MFYIPNQWSLPVPLTPDYTMFHTTATPVVRKRWVLNGSCCLGGPGPDWRESWGPEREPDTAHGVCPQQQDDGRLLGPLHTEHWYDSDGCQGDSSNSPFPRIYGLNNSNGISHHSNQPFLKHPPTWIHPCLADCHRMGCRHMEHHPVASPAVPSDQLAQSSWGEGKLSHYYTPLSQKNTWLRI